MGKRVLSDETDQFGARRNFLVRIVSSNGVKMADCRGALHSGKSELAFAYTGLSNGVPVEEGWTDRKKEEGTLPLVEPLVIIIRAELFAKGANMRSDRN